MRYATATWLAAVCYLAGAGAAALAAADADWAALQKQFLDVPMEARRLTGPLFWLHGDESKERLERYVGKVAEGHNGTFCAESRPHSDWLGPGWYRDLDICLQSAKRLGLTMWIFDEKWWPSQMIGGKVPPRYGGKRLEAAAVSVEGPKALTDAGFGGQNFVAAVAGREVEGGIDGESLVDLADKIRDGALLWDVPAGKWKVMKFTWKHDPRKPILVDGASQDCVDWFIQTVYQPHYDRFKDDFGKWIVGYFYDEPETHGDWGTEVPKVLAERKIDWKKAYVAWKFQLRGEEQTAARYAYQDAFSEAWGRTMYGRTTEWCHQHKVRSMGHFLEHGFLYLNRDVCAGNMIDLQKHSDMGGIDLVCQQMYPGQRPPDIYQTPKLGSSISHVYHKTDDIAFCEIFGAYGQHITYPEMKWLADQHQVRGINFMVPHSINPRAPRDTDCPPYFYADDAEPRWPLYRIWSDYNNRLSLLLTGGRHVCPVALLFCGNSAHLGKYVTPEDMTTALQDALFDCDWMPYEVLERDVRIAGKELVLYGERYRVLVVPPVEVIPYATLVKVREFFDAGGIVVGYGFLPSKSATLGKTSAAIAALVDAVWGQGGAPGLAVRKSSAAGGRSYLMPEKPKPEELQKVLAEDAGVRPAMEVVEGKTDNWVHVLHRVKADRDIFLVCNQNHLGEARRLKFRASAAGVPERWDAMRNEISAIPFKGGASGGATEFALMLEPNESALIVFSPDGKAPSRIETMAALPGQPIAVVRDNPPPASAAPPPAEKLTLAGCPWVWFPEGNPRVSAPLGTRYFRREITLPAGAKVKHGRFLMTADNDFVLFVNGKEAGRSGGATEAWRQPVEVDFTKHLSPGTNVLAIAATNTTDKPSPAGLIGRFRIDLDEGRPVTGCVDPSWKTAGKEAAGWRQAGFDDKSWPAALKVATFGEPPWGDLSGGGVAHIVADIFRGRCTIPAGVDLEKCKAVLVLEGLPDDCAAVTVNGAFAGGFLGRPCRLDVTACLKSGENTVEIAPQAPKAARLVFYPK
jgi:hypothetical protein